MFSPAPLQRPSAAARTSRARSVRVQASSSGGYFHSCHNGAHLSKARKAELEAVCEHIAQPGKGITACDEGPGTIGDRFAKYGIENSEEVRTCHAGKQQAAGFYG
jgi:fructose-bisphosphate aldolase class I